MCYTEAKTSLAMISISILAHARHHPLPPDPYAHHPPSNPVKPVSSYPACITLKLLQVTCIIMPTNRALLSPHPNNLACMNTLQMRTGALPACVASHNASGNMHATRRSVCLFDRCAGLAYASTTHHSATHIIHLPACPDGQTTAYGCASSAVLHRQNRRQNSAVCVGMW